MAEAPLGYTDTKRAKVDVENPAASFFESYLGYRTPMAMTMLRARISALMTSDASGREATAEINKLIDAKARIATAMAGLEGERVKGGAQRDTNLASVIGSATALAQENLRSATAAGVENSQAGRDEMKTTGAYDVAAINQTVLTDRTKPIVESFRTRLAGTASQVRSGQQSAADGNAMMDAAVADVKKQLSTIENPLEVQAAEDALRSVVLAGSQDPVVREALMGSVGGKFQGSAAAARPVYTGGGMRAPQVDVNAVISDAVKTYKSSGARDMATLGGSTDTTTKTSTSTTTSGPTGSSTSTETEGAQGPDPTQSLLDELLSQAKGIDARISKLETERASASSDPFRGLGSFYERPGGSAPARPRPERAGVGGSPAAPKEPKRTPKEMVGELVGKTFETTLKAITGGKGGLREPPPEPPVDLEEVKKRRRRSKAETDDLSDPLASITNI